MSIETLKQDLKQVTLAIQKDALGPLVSAEDLAKFLRDNLLPWLEAAAEEVGEMDESIEDLVHQTPDVLHTDSSELFASVIAGGILLVNELRTRVGNDGRLLKLIREWTVQAKQAGELLEDITIPDEDGEEEGDEVPATPTAAPEPVTTGVPVEGDVK